MSAGVWVVIGFVVLLLVLFLAYRAVTEWEVLDNQRRQRERERERRTEGSGR
jgi:multisubunit Na+/H+ antiporter MnhC subunit